MGSTWVLAVMHDYLRHMYVLYVYVYMYVRTYVYMPLCRYLTKTSTLVCRTHGIFAMIDEQLRHSNGSDVAIVQQLAQVRHPSLSVARHQHPLFVIAHFAGSGTPQCFLLRIYMYVCMHAQSVCDAGVFASVYCTVSV